MSDVLILIPAAGASTRMRGRDKLLQEVDGLPVLAHLLRAARGTGAPVLVTLAQDRPERAEALVGQLDASVTLLPIDGREGMAVSIRRAVALAKAMNPVPDGLMILPADMPELETSDLTAVMASFVAAPQAIHRGAGADGTPGHPVIIPQRHYPALEGLRGDEGARSVLRGEEVRLTALPGRRALTDLDTPEDWAAWRAGRSP